MTTMEQRVEFQSEGETIVGTLFRPDGAEGPLPTVVAGGGWCYVKEIVLPHVARSVWPFPRTHEVFHQLKATEAPRHEHWNTIQSAELLLDYTVFPYLPRILNKDVMMIVAEADNLTLWDLEIDAFNRVPSP